jgi:hypothetical protein
VIAMRSPPKSEHSEARPKASTTGIAGYLFGRNALIGAASFLLVVISGYATWHGMRDFIVGVSAGETASGNGLAVSNDLLIVVVVVALTLLMWLALRETFGARRLLRERLITFPLYLFLALWSIGFGYGFWWSLIAGQEATRTGLLALQEDARDAGAAVKARLDAVRSELDGVVAWSESQMAREEAGGGSCGVPSNAGRGPLYNARLGVRDSIASLRDSIATSWLQPVEADLAQLRQGAVGFEGATLAERQSNFEGKASAIRNNARAIAARSNEFGKTTAAQMRALAGAVSAAPNQTGFSCYDPTLAQRLNQTADQADQSARLKLPEAVFNEGPAGVANAIKRLWSNIGATLSNAATHVREGRLEGIGTPRESIAGRDLIALLATLGVDLGLLALTLLNPSPGPLRRDAMVANQAKLRLPTEAIIKQLTSAMQKAINRAPGADFDWVRRHLIHHDGFSYLVIPNLYSVDQHDKDEQLRALAMNQLAGVLNDLNLVRALSRAEQKRLGQDEVRDSFGDLAVFRRKRLEANQKAPRAAWWRRTNDQNQASRRPTAERLAAAPLRNHGLLSKAKRALEIGGWSIPAQADAEIYRLVDAGGLTPLLTMLDEAKMGSAAERPFAAPRREIAFDGPHNGEVRQITTQPSA